MNRTKVSPSSEVRHRQGGSGSTVESGVLQHVINYFYDISHRAYSFEFLGLHATTVRVCNWMTNSTASMLSRSRSVKR